MVLSIISHKKFKETRETLSFDQKHSYLSYFDTLNQCRPDTESNVMNGMLVVSDRFDNKLSD